MKEPGLTLLGPFGPKPELVGLWAEVPDAGGGGAAKASAKAENIRAECIKLGAQVRTVLHSCKSQCYPFVVSCPCCRVLRQRKKERRD